MPFTSYNDISAPPTYRYFPQKDITAYELAQLMPLLIAAWKNKSVFTVDKNEGLSFNCNEKIEAMSDDLKRHFRLG